MKSPSRLHGLDLARLIAFVGMVIVNFKVVMLGAGAGTDNWYYSFAAALEGKAAATFVVLAGLGLGLAYKPDKAESNTIITLRRAVFLLVIGLLNSLIFEADILHYYAFYFFFGAMLISLSTAWLAIIIAALNVLFVTMILVLDYNTGWDWTNLTYSGFWTPDGFIRNLFFNGWHPIIPWLGFLLFGLILSRLKLGEIKLQITLASAGAVMLAIMQFSSRLLVSISDPEMAELFTTSPIPPLPLYTLAGLSAASMTIGLCLIVANWRIFRLPMKLLTPAGRQTLTLYIAHIIIGMGTLESLDMLQNQNIETVFTAVLIFCIAAIIYAWVWSKFFKRGPAEALMRKTAG